MDHKTSKLLTYNVWRNITRGILDFRGHCKKINFYFVMRNQILPHYLSYPRPLPSRKKFPSPGSCMLVSDVKEFGALRHLCQNLSTICCSPYNFLEREIFNFCAQQQSLNVLFYCLWVAQLIFKSLLTFNFFLFHQNTRRFCRLCSSKLNAT